MDQRQLIAALVEKTGIRICEDDPAFLLVHLNLLMLEDQANEAVRKLSVATDQFNVVTMRNVDDFVVVANEALSKFMQRTNEIKAALDNLAQKPPAAAPVQVVHAGQANAIPAYMVWVCPLLLAAGVVIGAGLSLIIK